jgi:hypothetical protein
MDKELLMQFFLESFPNPERKDCPEFEALEALVAGLSTSNSSTLRHIASCSECFGEYSNLHLDLKERVLSHHINS